MVRKQCALSKSGQKTTSNEGSLMAKARPCLVASRSLGPLVNRENTDERKACDPLQDQKSDILKRVDKRMFQ